MASTRLSVSDCVMQNVRPVCNFTQFDPLSIVSATCFLNTLHILTPFHHSHITTSAHFTFHRTSSTLLDIVPQNSNYACYIHPSLWHRNPWIELYRSRIIALRSRYRGFQLYYYQADKGRQKCGLESENGNSAGQCSAGQWEPQTRQTRHPETVCRPKRSWRGKPCTNRRGHGLGR